MRPRKDKFEETSIGFVKGTEHELVYVSSPSFSKVTFKTKVAPKTIEEEHSMELLIKQSEPYIIQMMKSKNYIEKQKLRLSKSKKPLYPCPISVKNAMKKAYQESKKNPTKIIILE